MTMAAGTSTLWDHPTSFKWLRNFLREELAPHPGRGAKVARIVIATTIVMLINMTFRIPYGVYGAAYAFFISRESAAATLADTRTTVIAFVYAVLYVLIAVLCIAGDPVLRLVWVLGSLFLIFFGLRVIPYKAATRFGYLIIIVIPLWDREIPAEQKVAGTLWAIFAISFATIITAVIELMYVRLFPLDNLTGELVERLSYVAALLRSLASGIENPEAARQVNRLAILGTSRMRRDFIRSDRSPETADRMGAIVALVGRLVDLSANAAALSEPMPKEDCPSVEQLAGKIELLAGRLRNGNPLPIPHRLEKMDLCHNFPLLSEIEKTVKLIDEVLNGSEVLEGYYPAPKPTATKKRLFAADAFSNPEYVQFAIRGGLAASTCYLAYNLIAWPGISTAVTTCFLTAQTTIGSSRQKQILRIGGAFFGGVILGFGSQIFILPAIDSIVGFTVLFVLVTTLAAWIITSSARLSYFGPQTAIAFYLINLQEFKFQTSLAVARDRVAGIFLGLLAMWFIFDQLWGAPAVVEMQRSFVSTLRLLAKLMRAPVAKVPSAAIEETLSLRETIDTNFEALRQYADGVLLEFGRTRERNLALRTRLLQWQLQLRILFIVRVALLKYRLRLPGFELPEAVLRMQEQLDAQNAQRLEKLADLVSGKPDSSITISENRSASAQVNLEKLSGVSKGGAFPGNSSFASLSSRIDSLLASLESEITNSASRL